jgi:hypothetical protein
VAVAPFFPPGAWLDGHASRSCPGFSGADGPAIPGSSRRGGCRRAAQPLLLKLLILLHILEQDTPVAMFATCYSPPAAWRRSLGLLAHRREVLLRALVGLCYHLTEAIEAL